MKHHVEENQTTTTTVEQLKSCIQQDRTDSSEKLHFIKLGFTLITQNIVSNKAQGP